MSTNLESNGGQAPLDGVILCCTSISPEKRTELANIALQMGAIHKHDLTSDVTHLIVGDTDTPKYKFVAKERPDVKCLLPAWVEALRELWMDGGEPDVQALESRYRLPALHNLRICLTGFEDMSYRKQLEDHVNHNGGSYRANLTKDVTHLIAKEPTGAKYKYAADWNIKIVAAEWLDQSLERGMILDEKLYSLSIPPTERGRNAWNRRTMAMVSPGKRAFDGDALLNGPRKLRRVASTKLSSQNVGLWTDIVSGDIKVEDPRRDQWSEQPVSHVSTLHRGSSIVLKSESTCTETSKACSESSATAAMAPVTHLAPPMTEKRGIFAGKRFYLHGFNEKKTSVLHKHLLSHDAEVLTDYSSLSTSVILPPDNEFFLVPHDMPRDQIPTFPKNIHPPILVTDMWIERNLHRKQYTRPGENVTNTPFQRFPIPGFERLTICSTRFEGVDLLHMSRTAKLMGATYDEEFTSKASVLVCHQVIPGHEKLRHAQHWNIPTVTATWLWDCIRSGEFKPFRPYLTQPYSARPDPGAQKQTAEDLEMEIKGDPDDRACNKFGPHPPAPQDSMLQATKSKPKSKDDEETSHDGPAETGSNGSRPPSLADGSKPHLSQAVPKPPFPLHEISLNSSPPKPPTSSSEPKPIIKPLSSESTLSSAINSLLAHHQSARSSAHYISNDLSAQNPSRPQVRRKRQLLGRAPSNASNVSRASSVDTINTDGIGTPVDPTHASLFNRPTVTSSSRPSTGTDHDVFDPQYDYGEEREQERRTQSNDEQLQMTQLGYEDPDALAWREKVERKLGGGGAATGNGEGGRSGVTSDIGVVKDVTGRGIGAVGKRTRQALGR